eukprot:990851-Karenia_brevis.AAC.1
MDRHLARLPPYSQCYNPKIAMAKKSAWQTMMEGDAHLVPLVATLTFATSPFLSAKAASACPPELNTTADYHRTTGPRDHVFSFMFARGVARQIFATASYVVNFSTTGPRESAKSA